MDLYVKQESVADGVRRTLQLKNIAGSHNIDIFFDLVGENDVPAPTVLDGFVFGVIFYAMRLNQPLQVHGAMSRQALYNLHEFQEAWVSWVPNVYKKITITPSETLDVADLGLQSPRALCAYSGGVDSTFTMLRHNKNPGGMPYAITAGLLVHGFDVPLSQPQHLENLKNRVTPLLKSLNVTLKVIRTNLKELDLMPWEQSHAAQLACCLHNYSHAYNMALIASTEPYTKPILGWGSNPMTDHLMTGETMRLIHDGAGYSRTQKVELIATNKMASKALKVCWEGKETSKNCGRCEKCIRTQANFLCVGVTHAPCFETPFDVRTIATMDLRNDVQYGEMVSIYDYARRKHGVAAAWLNILKSRIDAYRPAGKWRTFLILVKGGEFSKIYTRLKTMRRRAGVSENLILEAQPARSRTSLSPLRRRETNKRRAA